MGPAILGTWVRPPTVFALFSCYSCPFHFTIDLRRSIAYLHRSIYFWSCTFKEMRVGEREMKTKNETCKIKKRTILHVSSVDAPNNWLTFITIVLRKKNQQNECFFVYSLIAISFVTRFDKKSRSRCNMMRPAGAFCIC